MGKIIGASEEGELVSAAQLAGYGHLAKRHGRQQANRERNRKRPANRESLARAAQKSR